MTIIRGTEPVILKNSNDEDRYKHETVLKALLKYHYILQNKKRKIYHIEGYYLSDLLNELNQDPLISRFRNSILCK